MPRSTERLRMAVQKPDSSAMQDRISPVPDDVIRAIESKQWPEHLARNNKTLYVETFISHSSAKQANSTAQQTNPTDCSPAIPFTKGVAGDVEVDGMPPDGSRAKIAGVSARDPLAGTSAHCGAIARRGGGGARAAAHANGSPRLHRGGQRRGDGSDLFTV